MLTELAARGGGPISGPAEQGALGTTGMARPDQSPKRAGQAMAGTFALALLLAFSRWGSYLHVPGVPLFLTDLLIMGAVLHAAATRLVRGRRPAGRAGGHKALLLPLLVLAWAAARLALGNQHDLLALRDAVPYLYAGVALLAAHGYRTSDRAGRARTVNLLHAALIVHLGWMLLRTVLPDSVLSEMPVLSPNTRVLDVRGDADGAFLSVLIGIALLRALRGRRPAVNLVIAGLSGMLLLTATSRAGLLALLSALTLVAVAFLKGAGNTSHRKLFAVAVAPAMLLPLALASSSTTPVHRLLLTVEPNRASTTLASNTLGTTRAREQVWRTLVEFTTEDSSRTMIGVGFGTDFLAETGMDVVMGSRTYAGVRSPHNYLVGTFVRLGLIGTTLVAALLAMVLAGVWRARTLLAQDDLLALCSLIAVTVLPVALVGVVMESPFGAVPEFWAAGILLLRPGPR